MVNQGAKYGGSQGPHKILNQRAGPPNFCSSCVRTPWGMCARRQHAMGYVHMVHCCHVAPEPTQSWGQGGGQWLEMMGTVVQQCLKGPKVSQLCTRVRRVHQLSWPTSRWCECCCSGESFLSIEFSIELLIVMCWCASRMYDTWHIHGWWCVCVWHCISACDAAYPAFYFSANVALSQPSLQCCPVWEVTTSDLLYIPWLLLSISAIFS